MTTRLPLLAALALSLAAAASVRAAGLYTVTDLGTLGGIFSDGQGVNDSGQVTGPSTTTGNVEDASLY